MVIRAKKTADTFFTILFVKLQNCPCCILRCLMRIVVSCLVCIVVVLCVLL